MNKLTQIATNKMIDHSRKIFAATIVENTVKTDDFPKLKRSFTYKKNGSL